MKYVIGNWKMHLTVPEAIALAGSLEDGLEDLAKGGRDVPEVIVCPPFVSLSAVRDVIGERVLKLGAQDVHQDEDGPHTGNTSVRMLQDLVRYVLIGHSERRRDGETEEETAAKVAAASRGGLVPVLCVGEESATDIAIEDVDKELRQGLHDVNPAKLERLLVAYEPVWAIGSGAPADHGHISEVAARLHQTLDELGFGSAEVLYGGSVTGENVGDFLNIKGLGGLLVGGASLDDRDFISIVEQVAQAVPHG